MSFHNKWTFSNITITEEDVLDLCRKFLQDLLGRPKFMFGTRFFIHSSSSGDLNGYSKRCVEDNPVLCRMVFLRVSYSISILNGLKKKDAKFSKDISTKSDMNRIEFFLIFCDSIGFKPQVHSG